MSLDGLSTNEKEGKNASNDKYHCLHLAIDGNYTDWSESSECSVTCGGGTQTLTRACTNPPPANGGKDCSELGPATKDVSCNEQECRKLTLFH